MIRTFSAFDNNNAHELRFVGVDDNKAGKPPFARFRHQADEAAAPPRK